ncbi:MAG: N-acetylmuramoyl-L-alanine amidase [Pseudomonadota bacterium]
MTGNILKERGVAGLHRLAAVALATVLLGLFAALAAPSTPATAQQLSALARVDAAASGAWDEDGDTVLALALSQPIPYRIFALEAPYRIVVDFREVDWTGIAPAMLDRSDNVVALRVGLFRPGWSRLVMELAAPMAPTAAALTVDRTRGTARLNLRLVPTDRKDFGTLAARAPQVEGWPLPAPNRSGTAKPRQLGNRPLIVVIDPGHGGIDGGAERDGYREKDLVLQFSRELQEALLRSGRYRVHLTRNDDRFLSLPDRITIARQKEADVFLSIHADALSEGQASGTTVYTLSARASNAMAAELAASHDRSDLLAGVDLSQQDDQIAAVLMDLARLETDARAVALADTLVEGIAGAVGRIRKRPRLEAGFTVLKAPDIPSVLVELGFMSSRQDLSNLLTPAWRAQVIDGVIAALDTWTIEDAAQARLLRK